MSVNLVAFGYGAIFVTDHMSLTRGHWQWQAEAGEVEG